MPKLGSLPRGTFLTPPLVSARGRECGENGVGIISMAMTEAAEVPIEWLTESKPS